MRVVSEASATPQAARPRGLALGPARVLASAARKETAGPALQMGRPLRLVRRKKPRRAVVRRAIG